MRLRLLAFVLIALLATGCRATFTANAWQNGGELSARLEVLQGPPEPTSESERDPN